MTRLDNSPNRSAQCWDGSSEGAQLVNVPPAVHADAPDDTAGRGGSPPTQTRERHPHRRDARPADGFLLGKWERSLCEAGWTPASARRASNRLRRFARATGAGLVHATKADVMAFAQGRGNALGTDLVGLLRNEGWQEDIRAIRRFYRWTRHKFAGVVSDPTVGIRQLPGRPPGLRIRSSDARLYDATLNAPGLGARDQLIVLLLGHGLRPHEVARLRARDVVLARHLLTGRAQRRRMLVLSDKGMLGLARWLGVCGVHSPYLFPGPDARKPISSSTVRAVTRRCAQLAFPHPRQDHLRRRVHAGGFRHVFLWRSIQARVAPPCLRLLAGVDRLSRLDAYIDKVRLRVDSQREIARMSKRWRKWI